MIFIKRLSSVFFCVFLLICLTISAFAIETVTLDYADWIWYYDLVDNQENYDLWYGMYSYGGSQDILPIDVPEVEYNAKRNAEAQPDSESEVSSESVPSESDSDSPDSGSVVLPSSESVSSVSSPEVSIGQASSISESPVLMATAVPTSGSSYIQPERVSIEYAPDATEGSLLSVLYGLLGKPVVAYTYKVQTNYNNQTYGYVTEHLDYDSNWVCSLVFLLVVVFCVFKAGGALLSKT